MANEIGTIVVGEPLDAELFNDVLAILKTTKIMKRNKNSTRWGQIGARFCTFGKTKGRYDGILRDTSYTDRKKPKLSNEINKIGAILKEIYGFNYNAVHLNNNVTCPPHYDGKNVGDSILISFGDYTGGNIVIEGKIYDAYLTPIMFNGSQLEHWNTDDLQGNKYSLVFFCNFVL
jgi:hypothetical protein